MGDILLYILRSTRIVVKRRLCDCGVSGEEGFEECKRMDTLPFGRLYQAGYDAVSFEPLFRSRSEAHFTEDYRLSQGLLGMIIGWGYAWDAEKSKEVFLLRAYEVDSQGFGRLEPKGE
jgi:hypothetical protein